jgi:succinate-semialdehyde dehydrogenase/glutarate-semialdehyde dehydrogenase
VSYPNTKLHISGKWVDGRGGELLPVVNPVDHSVIGGVAMATRQDLDDALSSVKNGFLEWSSVLPIERSKVMRKAATLLRSRVEHVARCMTMEQGKPLHESRAEVISACDIIEWFADEGLRCYGRIVPSRFDGSIRQMVVKDPIGPVVAFVPWNFPILVLVRKISAALAAGCSMIVKAPEETPASPAELVRAFVDAGLPDGTLNLVYGDPVFISDYLIKSPVIRKVTFTGSTPVGKILASLAGQHMKRVTMELGGHAPVIVCEDADLDLAIKKLVAGKYRNAGQICICPTRFLVHKSIVNDFSSEFAKCAESLTVGDGLLEDTVMGPLANDRRLKAMSELTDDAVRRGAKLLTGGEKAGGSGNFWAPTVLSNVPRDARIFNEEPFGPIAPISAFESLDEAIEEANRLDYGLASYAFTRSLKNSDIIARRVQAGMLWINSGPMTSPELPFGGMKDSGFGTEGGYEALEEYKVIRSVSIAN